MASASPTNIARGTSSFFGQVLAILIVLSSVIQPSFARQALNRFLVHGEGFVFSTKEPRGWKGDTENAAKFESNLIFHEIGQPMESATGLIRVRIDEKVDENTLADLNQDMSSYKAKYAKIRFKRLTVNNEEYVCLAAVFYVPGEFYEYVSYVNPGPGKPFLFSVSMNTQKSEASAKELRAYKLTVESLKLIKP